MSLKPSTRAMIKEAKVRRGSINKVRSYQTGIPGLIRDVAQSLREKRKRR